MVDEVILRYRERPIKCEIVAHRQPEVPVEARLDCGLIDLAVALRGMAVTDAESAPSTQIGSIRRVPATSSLLSIFPP